MSNLHDSAPQAELASGRFPLSLPVEAAVRSPLFPLRGAPERDAPRDGDTFHKETATWYLEANTELTGDKYSA